MTVQLPSVLRRLLAHPRGMVPTLYVPTIIVLCGLGPWLLPFGELHVDLYHRFLPPLGNGHLLGTDEIGRDVLSRVLMGGACFPAGRAGFYGHQHPDRDDGGDRCRLPCRSGALPDHDRD